MKSSNILSSTPATGINPAVASTSASNAPVVTTPDGSSPVTHGTLLLAEKLRSEKLESLQEFAFSLGLTAAHLQCLVGIFMPIETGGAPKQYKFELSHREEKNRQSMLFDGKSTLRIDGDDSRLIKQQFKRFGLPYREDASIDALCKNFATLTAKRQRKELAARFGTERERLMPQAMPVWFWQHGIDHATLAGKIQYLAAQGQPIPPVPDDIDKNAAAAAYGAACETLLETQGHAKDSIEYGFLQELQQLCHGGLQADKVQESAERQQARIQLNPFHTWCKNRFLLTSTQTNFDTPWRTGLVEMLVTKYPKDKSDWKGKREMSKKTFEMNQNTSEQVTTDAHDAISSVYDVYMEERERNPPSALGHIPELDERARQVNETFDNLRQTVQDNITTLLANYKRNQHSLAALNSWFRAGVTLLAQRVMHSAMWPGSRVRLEFSTMNNRILENKIKISDSEVKTITEELTKYVPGAIESDLMPNTAICRDLYEAMHKLPDYVPQQARLQEFDNAMYETVFFDRMMSLREYWKLDYNVVSNDWRVGKIEKPRESMALATRITKASLTQNAGSNQFLSNIKSLHDYAGSQFYALDVLTHKNFRKFKEVTREKVVAAGKNLDVAARAFREMSNAYLYLCETAGQPAPDDAILAAFERQAVWLETAGLLAQVVKDRYMYGSSDEHPDSTGASVQSGTQTTESSSQQQQQHYIPQDVDIDSIQRNEHQQTDEVPETIETSALQPAAQIAPLPTSNKHLTEMLKAAQAQMGDGQRKFAGINGSASQENSILLASMAKTAYQMAAKTYEELLIEIGKPGRTRPPELPEMKKLKSQHAQAAFWKSLTHALTSSQLDRLLFPTAEGAVASLLQQKACTMNRPSKFLHTFHKTDPKTGHVSVDKMIELEIGISATADAGGQPRKELVQTMVLHCHVDPALEIDKDTPADLKKIKKHHILQAHLKPIFYRVLTDRTASVVQTETGARQRARIPRCPVPISTTLAWLNAAASKK
jgi:hypothetical protein